MLLSFAHLSPPFSQVVLPLYFSPQGKEKQSCPALTVLCVVAPVAQRGALHLSIFRALPLKKKPTKQNEAKNLTTFN